MRLRFALLATLAMIVASALSAGNHGNAGAVIDLSGDWTVAVEGDVTLTCTVTVQQTGNELTAQLNCPGTTETSLYGSFDAATRQVDLDLSGEQGLDVELHGTASEDGNEVDGEWNWSYELFGTFHAARGALPPAVPDIGGSWHIWTTGDDTAPCDATVQQGGTAVELVLACPGQSSATLSGELDGQLLDAERRSVFHHPGVCFAGRVGARGQVA